MSANSDTVSFAVNLAFNLLLFGCLIAGAVVIAFRLVKNASPRLRYVVAAAAFLLAALLPLAFTLNGSFDFSKLTGARTIGGENNFDKPFFGQPVVAAPEIASFVAQIEPGKTSSDYLNDFTAAVAESWAGKILFSLWILGATGFAFRDVFALWQIRKMRQSWRAATVSERKELSVPENVSLYFIDESPATIGLFRPAIVLPKSFPNDLSLSQKRFIVRHELSHARWRDPLANFILRLMRAAFWISPALWLLERIAVSERESAADRAAVVNDPPNESESENAALDYVMTLVSVAQHFGSDARRDALLGANVIGLYHSSILKNRVRRLLARSSKTTSLRVFLAAVICVSGFAGLFFMPTAFRAAEAKREMTAAVFEDQVEEESSQSETAIDSQSRSARNEPPQFVGLVENKEQKTESGISNQNENKPEHSSSTGTESYQIPRAIMIKRKPPGTLNDDAAANDYDDLLRKLSEEDMKRSGLNQKLDELSGKVQGLDKARKNLGSSNPQIRQKAVSQIDSLMQTVNESGRKSN